MLPRIGFLAIVVGSACTDPNRSLIAGTYSYIADSARSCREGPFTDGYPCDCDPPYRYEGVLTLWRERDLLGGVLRYRECPGGVCGEESEVAVVEAQQHMTGDSVAFSLVRAPNGFGGSGAWPHYARWNGDRLVGRYSRSDGSIRGCGAENGPFTAIRLP